ncbi:MAG: hypothetical protein IJF07_08760, partial [Lachnospiraceae bacterium]|nr:hypothetical protein [Lachnospiraceae bacterium]
MKYWKNIIDLQLHKKRFIQVLIIAQMILLVIGIAGLFGKDEVYYYDAAWMKPVLGVYSEQKGGYYIDASVGQTGNIVEFEKLSLPRGIYQVALQYDTDTDMKNMCLANDLSTDYKTFLCNGEHLYSGLHETDFRIWLLEDKEEIQFYVTYEGEGSATIKGLEIIKTNAMNRIFVFLLLVAGTIINACVIYAQYDKKYQIPLKQKNVVFGLGIIILLSSLPLMIDGTISSGDLLYHELRIEGIKDGILNGQFPVRIAPEWQQGYGYASSIFYGETVLYLAAFFRLLGFTLITSYRLFMFVVNIATVLIAYFCFKKMFQEEYAGLLCAGVYSLSIYRISKTFICGSLGETFGIMFLPLLAYGFYRVFAQDIREETYKRAWVPLTIGFTGLIQSHLLTCEQVGAFTILLCLIMVKRVFRLKTFVVLAKTVIYSALLSLWFLVPFLDYMLTGDFVIQNVSARTIQDRGLYPAHLLYTYYENGGNVLFEEAGMADSQPMGVGIVLLGAFVVWTGILIFRKTAVLSRQEAGLGKVTGAFALLAMCMSL